MTLAEQCEAIWPCGWADQPSSPLAAAVTSATVQGLLVEVWLDDGRYYVYVRTWTESSTDLARVLTRAHAHIVSLPPVPALAIRSSTKVDIHALLYLEVSREDLSLQEVEELRLGVAACVRGVLDKEHRVGSRWRPCLDCSVGVEVP